MGSAACGERFRGERRAARPPAWRRWLGLVVVALAPWLAVGPAHANAGRAHPPGRAFSDAFASAARAIAPAVVRVEADTAAGRVAPVGSGLTIHTIGHVLTAAALMNGAGGARVTLA